MRIIRTQGKRSIVTVDQVTNICISGLDPDKDKPMKILAYFQGDDHVVLGEYANKKRCIRVLDMIQEWLSMYFDKPSIQFTISYNYDAKKSFHSYMNFQMPDDGKAHDKGGE